MLPHVQHDQITPVEYDRLYDFARRGHTYRALDARHVAGSAMFHFETPDTTALHTGDCRATEALVADVESVCRRRLDHLYLDTTFCSPDFE